jgi:hypothetical protein
MSSALRRDRALPVLALVVVTLAMAGCGSGGGNSTANSAASTATTAASAAPASGQTAPSSAPTTSTPARAAQPAKAVAIEADAICRRRGLELAGAVAKSVTMSEIAGVAKRRLAIEQEGLGELGKLTPPSSIAGAWGQFVADAKRAEVDLSALAEAATESEPTQVESAGNLYKTAKRESEASAKRARLRDCAQYG